MPSRTKHVNRCCSPDRTSISALTSTHPYTRASFRQSYPRLPYAWGGQISWAEVRVPERPSMPCISAEHSLLRTEIRQLTKPEIYLTIPRREFSSTLSVKLPDLCQNSLLAPAGGSEGDAMNPKSGCRWRSGAQRAGKSKKVSSL